MLAPTLSTWTLEASCWEARCSSSRSVCGESFIKLPPEERQHQPQPQPQPKYTLTTTLPSPPPTSSLSHRSKEHFFDGTGSRLTGPARTTATGHASATCACPRRRSPWPRWTERRFCGPPRASTRHHEIVAISLSLLLPSGPTEHELKRRRPKLERGSHASPR